MDTNVL